MKKIDFENDLKNEISRIAKEIGFKISIDQGLYQVLLDYLTVRTKLIDPKPRIVLINPEFLKEIEKHPKRKEIKYIISCAQNGKNMNIFKSKKLLQSNFHDHLQNEWNIHHFHLSLEKDKRTNFVKQVNSLLFAYIEDKQIVFLGADTHKEGIFGDEKWIEILHEYFPKIIEKYRDNSILDISPNLKSHERQTLWNKGLSIGLTKIKGVVYHNPGIGRSLSGHGTLVTKSAIEISRWVYKLKEQLLEMNNEVCEYLKIAKEDTEFKIIIGEKTLELVELSSNTSLLEYPYILADKEMKKR